MIASPFRIAFALAAAAVIATAALACAHAADAPPAKPADQVPSAAGDTRTPAEVLKLVADRGATLPDWWDSVELKYPETLDLLGNGGSSLAPDYHLFAYMNKVIKPDPTKWRMGIKLLGKVVKLRKAEVAKGKDVRPMTARTRWLQSMRLLANSYNMYENDYARAAYWYRQILQRAKKKNAVMANLLARCYWKLGSGALAVKTLKEFGLDKGVTNVFVVETWGFLGEVATAERLAKALVAKGRSPQAYMALGNIYRARGQLDKALACYKKIPAPTGAGGHAIMWARQARVNMDAIALAPTARRMTKLPGVDAVLRGSSVGFRGPIEVAVTVDKNGKITAVEVVKSEEDSAFFVRAKHFMPKRILAAQSVTDVDTVTAATVSSQAILNATTKALGQAWK